MSLLETACPHCGKSMVFSPIDYINTEERPEMIQKVRDGEAFVSICGHCGSRSGRLRKGVEDAYRAG